MFEINLSWKTKTKNNHKHSHDKKQLFFTDHAWVTTLCNYNNKNYSKENVQNKERRRRRRSSLVDPRCWQYNQIKTEERRSFEES